MPVVEMLGQPAPLQDFVEAPQLGEAKRRREVAHAGLIGRCCADDDGGSLIKAVRAIAPQRDRDVDIVGHHHAALTADKR